MTNIVPNISIKALAELMPLIDADAKKSGLIDFDNLLSDLLEKSGGNKENEEKAKVNISAMCAGLFGALMPTMPATDFQNTQNIDGITQPNSEQLQTMITKIIDEINNTDTKIDIENSNAVGEILTDKPDIKSDVNNNEIKPSIKPDAKPKTELDTIPDFKLDGSEVQHSNIPRCNFIENKTSEHKPAKTGTGFTKEDISLEQNVYEITEKVLNNTETDNKIKPNLNIDNNKKEKTTFEPKQSFDLYILQNNEIVNDDSITTLIDKTDMLTEAVENQIIKSASFTEINGKQEFEIQLKPEFLGKIIIKLQNSEKGMKVKITTSNRNVKEILSNQSLQMQETIKLQGVELKNVEVVYIGLSSGNSNLSGDGKFKGFSKKNIRKARGEYEQSIISDITEHDKMQINYNGSFNYLI